MEKLNLSILNSSPPNMFRCEFCGSQVPSYGKDSGFCYFCELNISSLDEPLSRYPEFYAALNGFSQNTTAGKWAEAEDSLHKLIALRNSPEMTYVSGVFYRAYSDYMYSNRDYEYLGGFREQNSANINAGIELFYKSKALFHQAINEAEKSLQSDNTNEGMLFLKFMSEFKLKKSGAARKTLDRLNEVSNSMRGVYASMLYSSSMKDKRSMTFMKQLVDVGMVGAFYYFARLLTEQRKLPEAKAVLLKLLSKVSMPAAKSLLDGIEEAQELL